MLFVELALFFSVSASEGTSCTVTVQFSAFFSNLYIAMHMYLLHSINRARRQTAEL